MNSELKDYYLIEISDVNDRSNFFMDESDFLMVTSCIARLEGIAAYCMTADSVKLLVSGGGEDLVISKLVSEIKKYDEYFSSKYSIDGSIADIKPMVSKLSSFDELLVASKGIHTTPESWLHHPHSSIRAYLYDDVPEFLEKSHISNVYGSAVEYFEYLNK